MTLQFPNNPSTGQQFTASNGLIYRWDGEKWITLGSASVGDIYVQKIGDTMTGDLNLPNLVATGDIQSTSQNGSQIAGFRNQLINGGMQVHQRGTSGTSTTTSEYLTADRWRSTNNTTSTIFNDLSLAPIGFSKALRVNRSTGSPWIAQGIELPLLTNGNYRSPGPFVAGSVWTLSWWTKQTVGAPTVGFNDGVATSVNSVVNTVDTPVAIQTEGAWTRYSAKVTMISDTGSSANRCLRVVMNTGVGANTDFEIVGVQLEPGPVATPFEHRPIGTELALCERYFQKYDRVRLFPGNTSNVLNRFLEIPRPVVMRAQPTESGTPGNDVNSLTYPQSTESTLGASATVGAAADGAIITDYTADAEL